MYMWKWDSEVGTGSQPLCWQVQYRYRDLGILQDRWPVSLLSGASACSRLYRAGL